MTLTCVEVDTQIHGMISPGNSTWLLGFQILVVMTSCMTPRYYASSKSLIYLEDDTGRWWENSRHILYRHLATMCGDLLHEWSDNRYRYRVIIATRVSDTPTALACPLRMPYTYPQPPPPLLNYKVV